MKAYSQSILLFGIVLPGVVLGICTGLVIFGRDKLLSNKDLKEQLYEAYQMSSKELAAIEADLSVEGRSDRMEFWDAELKKEFIRTLTTNLNEITSQFSEDQLIRTELSRPSSRSPIASKTDNPHSRFKLSFEGGFGPMQTALAEMEMRMPQLVLEKLEMKPVRDPQTGKDRLQFDATYLAWYDIKEGQR